MSKGQFAKRLAQQAHTTRAMLEAQRWKNFMAEHEDEMMRAAVGGGGYITLPSRLFDENDWLQALLVKKGFCFRGRFADNCVVTWEHHI